MSSETNCIEQNNKTQCLANKKCTFNKVCEPIDIIPYSISRFMLLHQFPISIRAQLEDESKKKNVTNFESYMKNINVFSAKKKSSASNSVIIRSTIIPSTKNMNNNLTRQLLKAYNSTNNCIIKCFPYPSYDAGDNSGVVEYQIYKYILSDLTQYTPNLINYLGYIACQRKDIRFTDKNNRHNWTTQLDNIDVRGNDHMKFLFLESSNHGSFASWISHVFFESNYVSKRDFSTFLKCVFQILYTITCFERVIISQNDLHFSNILIEQLDRDVVMYFKISDTKTVEIQTNIIPKIYDFDRGFAIDKNVYRNSYVDCSICPEFDNCSDIFGQDKTDLFSFTFELFDMFDESSKHLKPINDLITWLTKDIVTNFNEHSHANHVFTDSYKTSKKLKSPYEALQLFINKFSSWFTIHEKVEKKPYIYFELPPQKKIVKYDYIPVKNKYISSQRRTAVKPALIINIILSWERELSSDPSYDRYKHEQTIAELTGITLSKHYLSNNKLYDNFEIYQYCRLLCFGFYYETSPVVVEELFNVKLINYIFDLFGGTLPVKVVRYKTD